MINLGDIIHPEDEAAKRQLEAIPGFTTAIKGFLRIGFEQMLHGTNMANKIRLSPKQLPDLYYKLPPICKKLGITEPEFYLEMNPAPNAYTFGDTRIAITVTSGLLEYLDEDELNAVIAHECGHILCRHVLYHSMANYLLLIASNIGLASTFIQPIQLGLKYWERRSELSADRAAAAVMGSTVPVVETMIRLAGGPKSITENVDINQYAAQAEAYQLLQESTWDKVLQTFSVMNDSHPFPAVRVKEILKWSDTPAFSNIINSINNNEQNFNCPGCGNECLADWKFCKRCGKQL